MTINTPNAIITENLCGYIDIKDSCFHTIWQAIGLNTSVTIKIKNMSNHLMRLEIETRKRVVIKIYPNDERIITIPNVHSISVQCINEDDENACYGSYQLIIHYPIDFKECKKHTCNEDVDWYCGCCRC